MSERPTRERIEEIGAVLRSANDEGPSERYLLAACADLLAEIDALVAERDAAVIAKNAMTQVAVDRERDARLLAKSVTMAYDAIYFATGNRMMPMGELAEALARHTPKETNDE